MYEDHGKVNVEFNKSELASEEKQNHQQMVQVISGELNGDAQALDLDADVNASQIVVGNDYEEDAYDDDKFEESPDKR